MEALEGLIRGFVSSLILSTLLVSPGNGEVVERTGALESVQFNRAYVCQLLALGPWVSFKFLPLHIGVIKTSLSCPSTMLELF
jgi:hypothetical protein